MSDLSPDISGDFSSSDEVDISSKQCYEAIKEVFNDYIPSHLFPTYDEWTEYIKEERLIHTPKLDFVNPGSGIGGAAATFAAKVGMDSMRRAGFSATTADGILDEMRQKATANLRQRARQTASNIFEEFKDKGDGGTSKADYQGGSRFNPTGLSQALKPIDTSFSTDITFQGDTRYWQDGTESTGPLFIKSGVPGLISPTAGVNRDQQMWDLISGPITREWNRAIANRITWTGRVVTLLTDVTITDYINRCLYACCVYYHYRSIIAFTDDPRNRNEGMDSLRDLISPTDYNNLFNLRRELMQSAIPPFVHEFTFYMMGTYRQNHLPSSPLMKIMPFGFDTTSNSYFKGSPKEYGADNLTPVSVARGHLNQLKEFNNVLSRAIGGWGGIEPFEYTSSPRVDMDYTTFWVNANYLANNSSGPIRFPKVDDINSELVYNSHTDSPDGWTSAMVSPTVDSTGDQGVGMFHDWVLDTDGNDIAGAFSVYSSGKTSTCFVYNGDGFAGFYPVETAQRYQSLSGNTFSTVANTSAYHRFQKFGTERIILTSVNALRQANFQFIDLLYTQDFKNLPDSTAWNAITAGKQGSSGKGKSYGGRKRGPSKGKKYSKGSTEDSMNMKDEV